MSIENVQLGTCRAGLDQNQADYSSSAQQHPTQSGSKTPFSQQAGKVNQQQYRCHHARPYMEEDDGWVDQIGFGKGVEIDRGHEQKT